MITGYLRTRTCYAQTVRVIVSNETPREGGKTSLVQLPEVSEDVQRAYGDAVQLPDRNVSLVMLWHLHSLTLSGG